MSLIRNHHPDAAAMALMAILAAAVIGVAIAVLSTPYPDDVCAICDGDHATVDHGTEEGW